MDQNNDRDTDFNLWAMMEGESGEYQVGWSPSAVPAPPASWSSLARRPQPSFLLEGKSLGQSPLILQGGENSNIWPSAHRWLDTTWDRRSS